MTRLCEPLFPPGTPHVTFPMFAVLAGNEASTWSMKSPPMVKFPSKVTTALFLASFPTENVAGVSTPAR